MAAVTYTFPSSQARFGGPAGRPEGKMSMALIGAAYIAAVVVITAAQINLDRAVPSFDPSPMVATANG